MRDRPPDQAPAKAGTAANDGRRRKKLSGECQLTTTSWLWASAGCALGDRGGRRSTTRNSPGELGLVGLDPLDGTAIVMSKATTHDQRRVGGRPDGCHTKALREMASRREQKKQELAEDHR